LSLKSKD